MTKNKSSRQGRVLMKGNEAIGAAALHAGCLCYFGYPITPQNELTAYMAKHMPEQGRVFIQAESEVAAINMVFGAAVTGTRVMTSSSSPGISLKQEGISYLAGSRLPAVIVNVQRGGPGLGNIAPAQGDYFQATKGGGHGDYHLIVLAPASVQEMHDMTLQAFELADRYRLPVMLLADGRLGQMMEPMVLRTEPAPPPPDKPWALTGAQGRAARSIHSLFLAEGVLEQHNLLLQAEYRKIADIEAKAETFQAEFCDVLIAAWGTCGRVAKGAVSMAREQGMAVGLWRPLTLWPFPERSLRQSAQRAKAVLVVEMNCGQMLEDVRLAVNNSVPVHFAGYPGGRVPTESDILNALSDVAHNRAPASAGF